MARGQTREDRQREVGLHEVARRSPEPVVARQQEEDPVERGLRPQGHDHGQHEEAQPETGVRARPRQGHGGQRQGEGDQADVAGGFRDAEAARGQDVWSGGPAAEGVREQEEQQMRKRQEGLAEGLVRDPGPVALRRQLGGRDDLGRGQGEAGRQSRQRGREAPQPAGGDQPAGREIKQVQRGGEQRVVGHLWVAREDLDGDGRGRAGHRRPVGPNAQSLGEQHQEREPGRGVDDRCVSQVRQHEARGPEGDPRQEASEHARADGARVQEGEERGQHVAGERHEVHGHGRGEDQE
jgi:hypothetical protein